jgi:hypothetical protein
MSERSLDVLAKRIDRLDRDNKRLKSALILFLAGILHDVSVVAIDGFNHQLQSWIDHCPGLLGIEVLHQLGRAFDVGEERGYRLAFAFGNRGICR